MTERMKASGLQEIDPRLLDEALRRAMRTPGNANVDPQAVLSAILAEARRHATHVRPRRRRRPQTRFELKSAGDRERA